MKLLVIAALCQLFMSATASGFETSTHYEMTTSIFNRLVDDALLLNLGMNTKAFNDEYPSLYKEDADKEGRRAAPICSSNAPRPIRLHLACGAIYEDSGFRPVNHFLDPQHPDAKGWGSRLSVYGQYSASIWALGSDDIQLDGYANADDRLWDAFTFRSGISPEKDDYFRKTFLSWAFRNLGGVMHLVQDMASPQHTRDEAHWDKADIGKFTQKSRYEQRAIEPSMAPWIQTCLIDGGDAAACTYGTRLVSDTPVYPARAELFQTPRAFWESSGQSGLSQVTARSFPSPRRNFGESAPGHFVSSPSFPLPQPTSATTVGLGELMNGIPDGKSEFLKRECGGDSLAICSMIMIGAPISDPLNLQAPLNQRASSFSLFDQDLVERNRFVSVVENGARVNLYLASFATLNINKFNIDRAYQYLIPRAMAYSAGMLNFYFRGKMSIRAPKGGAFAITDESTFSPANPSDPATGLRGFPRIRVALANTTSLKEDGTAVQGALPQPMTDGKLWLVMHYHRNRCFTDDFANMALEVKPLDGCIDPVEEVVVSAPVDRTGKGRQVLPMPSAQAPNGEELTFDFSRELPINAWNVLLQVIFRGTLGSEENKLAVSTIDISEPTFVSIANNTDFVYFRGQCYKPQDIKANPALWNLVSPTCKNPEHPEDVMGASCYKAKIGLRLEDASSDTPTFSVANEAGQDGDHRIAPGHFARFALLTSLDKGVDLRLKFADPNWIVPAKLAKFTTVPFRAHKSRIVPGEEESDYFVLQRNVRTWQSLALMIDVEKGAANEDEIAPCVGGEANTLSPLDGDARYPYPTTVTWAGS